MYSMIMVDSEAKKTNGVNKNADERIRHAEYLNVLFSRGLVRHRMKSNDSKRIK